MAYRKATKKRAPKRKTGRKTTRKTVSKRKPASKVSGMPDTFITKPRVSAISQYFEPGKRRQRRKKSHDVRRKRQKSWRGAIFKGIEKTAKATGEVLAILGPVAALGAMGLASGVVGELGTVAARTAGANILGDIAQGTAPLLQLISNAERAGKRAEVHASAAASTMMDAIHGEGTSRGMEFRDFLGDSAWYHGYAPMRDDPSRWDLGESIYRDSDLF